MDIRTTSRKPIAATMYVGFSVSPANPAIWLVDVSDPSSGTITKSRLVKILDLRCSLCD